MVLSQSKFTETKVNTKYLKPNCVLNSHSCWMVNWQQEEGGRDGTLSEKHNLVLSSRVEILPANLTKSLNRRETLI